MGKQDYWRERLSELEQSGLSTAEYCRRKGIRENQLSYWRKRVGVRPSFSKVGAGATIEMELSSGAKLKIPADLSVEAFKSILEAVNAVGN
jgi:transposase-like protein